MRNISDELLVLGRIINAMERKGWHRRKYYVLQYNMPHAEPFHYFRKLLLLSFKALRVGIQYFRPRFVGLAVSQLTAFGESGDTIREGIGWPLLTSGKLRLSIPMWSLSMVASSARGIQNQSPPEKTSYVWKLRWRKLST